MAINAARAVAMARRAEPRMRLLRPPDAHDEKRRQDMPLHVVRGEWRHDKARHRVQTPSAVRRLAYRNHRENPPRVAYDAPIGWAVSACADKLHMIKRDGAATLHH